MPVTVAAAGGAAIAAGAKSLNILSNVPVQSSPTPAPTVKKATKKKKAKKKAKKKKAKKK
jgi:enterochelin esterase-like enzyme